MLRVFHIKDTARVASTIAYFMDKHHQTKSEVFHRPPDGMNPYLYGLLCLWKARNTDIIHVHSWDKIIPYLKKLYDKPIILHYHGSDIRYRHDEKEKYWRMADQVLVSTPDLLILPVSTIHLPNPIDTKGIKKRIKHPSSAFHYAYNADDEAKRLADRHNLQLDIFHEKVSRNVFLHKMASYPYYIDIKRKPPRSPIIPALSLSGLEALSMGIKVIRWDGKILEGLPKKYEPKNVVSFLYRLYQRLFALAL